MADSVPNTIIGMIEFYEQRLVAWAADPAAIGLSAPQIAELQTTVGLARTRYTEAQEARQASRDATSLQTAAVKSLAGFGSGLIATIKAFADLSSDPATIFAAANVDMPSSTAATRPAPVPATDLATTLENSGAVRVSWKGTIAHGTYYDIYRELNASGEFQLIGSSSTRSFVDDTVPAGTLRAAYYTVSKRDGLSSGESESVNIRFGIENPPQSGSTSLGLAA